MAAWPRIFEPRRKIIPRVAPSNQKPPFRLQEQNMQNTPKDPDELLTRPEAAAILKIDAHTLACWASLGRGPRFVKFGASRSAAVRYRRSEIDRWLADPARADAETQKHREANKTDSSSRGNEATDSRSTNHHRRHAK
jgi:predicted DNA-binding transcriptional regulator AlpA